MYSHARQTVRMTCCIQSVFSSHCPFIPTSSPATSIWSALEQTMTIGIPIEFKVRLPVPNGSNGPPEYVDIELGRCELGVEEEGSV